MAEPDIQRKIKVGLLGSGTVGEALQEIVFENSKKKSAHKLEIVKIYTRNPAQKKWYAAQPGLFTTRPEEVIEHPDADIIIEALGHQREEELGTFKDYIIRSFQKGKSVVTSDKAVLAKFGREIRQAAARYGQELRFEACVGGGIPIIRSLVEGFAAEEPEAIYGIINGTCNFILSHMERGKSYDAALKEAQALGYAETNPQSDTSGRDAEAKLLLLAAVTFRLDLELGMIWRKGIEQIQAIDFLYADRKGRRTIKHLAVAKNEGGAIQAFVCPVMVPRDHFLAAIDGPTNAIFFRGSRSDGGGGTARDWNYAFLGPGAGGGPTAVAILGDVLDLGRRGPGIGAGERVSRGGSAKVRLKPAEEISAPFYIRFLVKDRAGIVGDIGNTFGKAGIHISEIWQLRHTPEELEELARVYKLAERPQQLLPFVITLEPATIGQIKNALEVIGRKDFILVPPIWFPIWSFGEN